MARWEYKTEWYFDKVAKGIVTIEDKMEYERQESVNFNNLINDLNQRVSQRTKISVALAHARTP